MVNELDGSKGIIFFAAGVFHYFKTDQVKTLALELAKRFPGGALVFDSVGSIGKRMMFKALKEMGMDDVKGYFHLNNPLRELNWSDNIRVKSRGYMLGYYNMVSPGIKPIHRFLARIGDNMLHMAVNRLDFL